mgnify:CR=1 FL=1
MKSKVFSFFLNLKFDRVSDGVHPTKASASKWMDTVASFIMNKSSNPIMLKSPKKKVFNKFHLPEIDNKKVSLQDKIRKIKNFKINLIKS